MEPPEANLAEVIDRTGQAISKFPTPVPLWWKHQQWWDDRHLPRPPIQPGDEVELDLVYTFTPPRAGFASYVIAKLWPIHQVPIPIEPVFFRVQLTATKTATVSRWFSIRQDAAAGLGWSVVSVTAKQIKQLKRHGYPAWAAG